MAPQIVRFLGLLLAALDLSRRSKHVVRVRRDSQEFASARSAAPGPRSRTFQLKRRLRAAVTHCLQIMGMVHA